MPKPNYIWRKRVDAAWLALNEAHFAALQHAVIELPNRSRLIMEVFCPTLARCHLLRQRFGGSFVRLRADWMRQPARKLLRIGARLVISNVGGTSVSRKSRRSHLTIPAGAAFGTGDHPTTAMSLRLLEKCTRKLPGGWRMIDFGTGSGIFAIAAARFGARDVVAVDNDPLALKTARQNAALNRTRGVKFILDDARQSVSRKPADVIAANLFSELLIEALSHWKTLLQAHGRLIVSGILREQERAVCRAMRQAGFAIKTVRRRGKWVAILAGHARSKTGLKSQR